MKIQKISQFQYFLGFDFLQNDFDDFFQRFLQSDLGKIYQAIPWDKLIKAFGLKNNTKGPESIFSPQGKIALMFLKSYTNVSDRKLIEQLNGNIEYQFFCDIFLGKERLTNYKIVSQIRTELAQKLSIDKIQEIFYQYWKPYMSHSSDILIGPIIR